MKKLGAFVLLLIGLLVVFAGLSFTKGQLEKGIPQNIPPDETPAIRPTSTERQTSILGTGEQLVVVIKVIDGDTIRLEDGRTVRYIGIDAAETSGRKGTECFAKESIEKNKELVEGKQVKLEKDVSETDRYGRLLRYVFVGNMFVNDLLVREGYAYASSYPPDVRYQQQFSEAQQEARENNRGLWGACSGPEVKGTKTTGDVDCTDFPNQEQAQAFFISQGGPEKDPHRLDQDHDGVACESLP